MTLIVLAYSGGLDTSIAIPWLAERYRAQIVTVTMDFGQGRELDAVRQRALACGAVRAHVVDLRERFASDFIVPALQAGALRDGRDPIAAALSRPLIAKHLVEIARIEGATIVAHGAGEKGLAQARLDTLIHALDPSLTVHAPTREWDMSRPAEIDYARERGIPVASTAETDYRVDVNLWGREIVSAVGDDTWKETPDELFVLTKSAAQSPDAPAYVEIEFDRGIPVKANGVGLPLVELITSVETIAGDHGVGRMEGIHRQAGQSRREIHEAPAAVVLHAAHFALQTLVSPPDLRRLTIDLGGRYADLIEQGLWFSPTREAIDSLVKKVQERVTGVVRLKLFKGDCRVVGLKSPQATSPISHVVGAGQ